MRMPGFERTREAAEVFAKLICCANPECRQESDNLQILGTACKHAFCWDCINSYSSANTLVLCPTCACPLDVNHPKAATLFNNLAQHINEFKLLLDEYERCLRNEGAAAAATMAQTQMLFQAHDPGGESDKAARNEAIHEFISTQREPSADLINDLDLDSPASDFSEELNITPPPAKNTLLSADATGEKAVEKPKHVVEFAECFDDFSDEDVTAAPVEDGVITDSVPQFDHPMMTSTQRPVLFLSQAVHARNELFQNETKQEAKTYHDGKGYNYFSAKPANTFDKRRGKVSDAPWLDLPQKKTTTNANEDTGTKEQVDFTIPSTSAHDEDRETPKRGPKIDPPARPRSRRSSFSNTRAHSQADDPVMDAVIRGNVEEVGKAIDAGHDVNQRDHEKRTPLFVAVEMKRLDICQVLVERGGAVINANCGPECNTALHIAVRQENEEIVRYLLSKGASKTIRNIRQETPSQLAQRRSPLRSLVEKYRTHPRQPLVARLPDVYVVCFARDVKRSLTYGEQSLLSKLMTVVEFCDEATTHYVVSADAEGVACVDADLLRAMLQNTRIMSVDWLKECVRLNSTVPHLHYEVSKLRYLENNVVVNSLERCRKSKERMEPGLFHGCVFYMLLKKYKGIDDRRLLPDLIKLGGGELSITEPHYEDGAPAPFHAPQLSSPIFIVYDVTMTRNIPSKFHRHPTRYNMVSAQWIIESVMEYGIKPIA
ncbi:hypothetical protein Y032_0108g46 [Ancylostoma ceylanicum]|uniref:Ankyrin repeat protein n=1 Tax=Ancylostoma ceylanicum TaxID=53326 RepID=A0A016TF75_9BILA|nr:hypothetical protein Y032_0108g46 [Ancylostoma ceylanicum]